MMKRLSFSAAVLSATLAAAQPCPARASWPTDQWSQAPVNATAKAAEIKALEDFAFTLTGTVQERKGYRTNGLLIVKNGAIVYEKYARGWTAEKKHVSWSVAKSVSTALIGVGVQQGLISIDDSVCKYLTEYAGDSKVCAISVRNFLDFSPGLQWQEEYEDKPYQVSSVLSMLFGEGYRDHVKHTLKHRKLYEPGTQFIYSTGTSSVVAAIAKRALVAKHGPDAFWTQLFDPIGMKGVVFEEDVAGTPVGGSSVYATPREYAKFGYLYLNDGCWNNTRILPPQWVAQSTTVSQVYLNSREGCSGKVKAFPFDGYERASPTVEADAFQLGCELPAGYQWWLNTPPPGADKPWPDAPSDTYAALGHWGQRIIVIPSEDVIIVRTGDDRAGSIPVTDLVKFALPVTRP